MFSPTARRILMQEFGGERSSAQQVPIGVVKRLKIFQGDEAKRNRKMVSCRLSSLLFEELIESPPVHNAR